MIAYKVAKQNPETGRWKWALFSSPPRRNTCRRRRCRHRGLGRTTDSALDIGRRLSHYNGICGGDGGGDAIAIAKELDLTPSKSAIARAAVGRHARLTDAPPMDTPDMNVAYASQL